MVTVLFLSAFWFFPAKANVGSCKSLFSQQQIQPDEFHYELQKGETIESLEPMFRAIIENQQVYVTIPKGMPLDLFSPNSLPYYGVHEGGPVEFYPYNLRKPKNEKERYTETLLREYYDLLRSVEKVSKNQYTARALRRFNDYFFAVSTTSGVSGALFQKPRLLKEIIDRSVNQGRPPFIFTKENGDLVLTNAHFLDYLLKTGVKKIKLFRGHYGFDYFFYRLFLKPFKNPKKEGEFRNQFAKWLQEQTTNLIAARNIKKSKITHLIQLLKDSSISSDVVLSEIAMAMTNSALFTSPTNYMSEHWTGTNHSSHREVLELELDLKKLPEWYLPMIQIGTDLDLEMVFPYLDLQQIAAIRSAIKIVHITPVEG